MIYSSCQREIENFSCVTRFTILKRPCEYQFLLTIAKQYDMAEAREGGKRRQNRHYFVKHHEYKPYVII